MTTTTHHVKTIQSKNTHKKVDRLEIEIKISRKLNKLELNNLINTKNITSLLSQEYITNTQQQQINEEFSLFIRKINAILNNKYQNSTKMFVKDIGGGKI